MGLKDRRIKRILFLAVLLVVLVGCKANIDSETGQLIAERIIDNNTKWSFSQGWFDFLIVMPIAKLILLCEGWMGIVARQVIAIYPEAWLYFGSVALFSFLFVVSFLVAAITQTLTIVKKHDEK